MGTGRHVNGAFQIRILAPVEVRPERWDILRRLGLRKRKRVQTIPPGKFLVCTDLRTLFVRPEDYARAIGRETERSLYSLPVSIEHFADARHRLRIPPPGFV